MSRMQKIDWSKGVRVYRRVPIPTENLPENFRKRPFSHVEVMKIEAEDFPIEEMESLNDLAEWIDVTLAPIFSDGIFYLHAYGDYTDYYEKRERRTGNIIRDVKGRTIWKKMHYNGLVPLVKFETIGGSFGSFIATRKIMKGRRPYWRKIRYNRDFRNKRIYPPVQPKFELMKWFGSSGLKSGTK